MNRSRAIIIIIAVFIFFCSLIFKLYDIQIIKSEELKYFAQRQQTKVEKIIPDRGVIYDRDGVLMVYDKNDVSYYLDLRMVSQKDKNVIAKKFSSVFGKSYEYYLKTLKQSPKTICIEKKVPGEKSLLLKDFKDYRAFQPGRSYQSISL